MECSSFALLSQMWHLSDHPQKPEPTTASAISALVDVPAQVDERQAEIIKTLPPTNSAQLQQWRAYMTMVRLTESHTRERWRWHLD